LAERIGEWRNENPPSGLVSDRPLSIAAQERVSKKMRDDLKNYLLNEGAVEWQLRKVTGQNASI